MRRAIGAWWILLETSGDKNLVRLWKTGGVCAQINHDIDIVSRACLRLAPLDFVQEHHLATDQQPMITQARRQLDERSPGLTLPSE
jgi:hypothetical protein